MRRRTISNSRLAFLAGRALRDAFARHRRAFRAHTRRTAVCFAHRNWPRLRANTTARLELYRHSVDRAERDLRKLLGERVADPRIWIGTKAVFSGLIAERHDWDLAETFFNSVTRRIFSTVGVDEEIEFVDTDFRTPPTASVSENTATYPGAVTAAAWVERVLSDLPLHVPWIDRADDARLSGERIEAELVALGCQPSLFGAEVLRPIFYRGKGAYIVARLAVRGPIESLPVVLALRNTPKGIRVDAVLLGEADVSMLFGFTRSYFHVDTPRPYDLVRFLRLLVPRKSLGELYISIGEPKQGKTQLYRDLLNHVEDEEERFCFAPGTPGLVMVVFTMPRYGMVLKVIRDRFPPEKKVTATQVKERYAWVYAHDRAGRLVDAQSFEHLTLDLDAFEPDLLDHLLDECGERVQVVDDQLVFRHVYLERKVRPLNLFLREAEPAAAAAAVLDYGQALRDLATCSIFPGDLLIKNFGVTRHGRVAFYDYDELVDLRDCNFRDIPEARSYEDELSAEPWYSVGPNDVFPEELPRFLGLPRPLRTLLLERRGELFTAAWWKEVQALLADGKIVEFSPYSPARRLREGPREGP